MHMADALLSPAVGGAMWAVTGGTIYCCARKIKTDASDSIVPLMGVLGAFIFAAQMINFTIPGTGSSGHLGGGMILAILLGPYAGFLTMASVLMVQALFFADGGLLALGCNIFNLGFFSCFIAYPLIYKKIAGKDPTQGRISAGALVSAVAALQLGAFAVVMETVASGISELPFGGFVLLMQPIHLAIGVVEGLVTTAMVSFIWKTRPEILEQSTGQAAAGFARLQNVLLGLLIAAVFTGGFLSWFASADPDGLEWSIAAVTGKEELAEPDGGVHGALAGLQEKTAVFPDYGFKKTEANRSPGSVDEPGDPAWPVADSSTSVSGLVGGLLTLTVALGIGLFLKRKNPLS